jgi:hypothetical protein
LRSTYAVVSYLKRVARTDAVALGSEPRRYYEYALADSAAPPGEVDPVIMGDGKPMSVPILPLEPMGTTEQAPHMLFRIILEDIATSPMQDGVSEADRIQALAEIDHLPVGYRAEMGRLLLSMMDEVIDIPKGRVKRFTRSIRLPTPGVPHLMFSVCSEFSPDVQNRFSNLVILRHYDFGVVRGRHEDLTTVAVMLTPRYDGVRPWDTTMIKLVGDLELTEHEISTLKTEIDSTRVT